MLEIMLIIMQEIMLEIMLEIMRGRRLELMLHTSPNRERRETRIEFTTHKNNAGGRKRWHTGTHTLHTVTRHGGGMRAADQCTASHWNTPLPQISQVWPTMLSLAQRRNFYCQVQLRVRLGSASAMQWLHNAGGWVHVYNNSNDDADDYHGIKHACDVMWRD